MRKAIFCGFITAGAAVGLFTALNGDWGLRLVMMGVGAAVGTAIGSALTRVGARPTTKQPADTDASYGQGTSAGDRDRNYWRDKGHPPFMKPSSAQPDRHMFDPDKVD